MNKAIVFTISDRVDYLKKTLESWSNVRKLNQFDFRFNIEPSEKLEEIENVIMDFFKKTKVTGSIKINNKVMGCATNTWFSFDDLFKEYDFVILAEDDIIVSQDIIEYFDYLENKYKDDDSVAIISANTKWTTRDPHLVVREKAFNGLVWGTWKKYWDNYFKDTWDFNYSSGLNGTSSGWDWNITLRILPLNNLFSIHPLVSRSQHIGIDGIHCTPEIFDQTQSPSFDSNSSWNELIEV